MKWNTYLSWVRLKVQVIARPRRLTPVFFVYCLFHIYIIILHRMRAEYYYVLILSHSILQFMETLSKYFPKCSRLTCSGPIFHLRNLLSCLIEISKTSVRRHGSNRTVPSTEKQMKCETKQKYFVVVKRRKLFSHSAFGGGVMVLLNSTFDLQLVTLSVYEIEVPQIFLSRIRSGGSEKRLEIEF
jgi:hypothetical protein